MQSLFTKCAHVWGDAKGFYHPPTQRSFSATGFVDFEMILRLMYGESDVRQTCTRCPAVKTIRVPGRADLSRAPFPAEDPTRTRGRFQKCAHEYTETRATFSPPQARSASMTGMVTPAQVRFIREGLSTLAQFCTRCHELHAVVRIGCYENAEPVYHQVFA